MKNITRVYWYEFRFAMDYWNLGMFDEQHLYGKFFGRFT